MISDDAASESSPTRNDQPHKVHPLAAFTSPKADAPRGGHGVTIPVTSQIELSENELRMVCTSLATEKRLKLKKGPLSLDFSGAFGEITFGELQPLQATHPRSNIDSHHKDSHDSQADHEGAHHSQSQH